MIGAPVPGVVNVHQVTIPGGSPLVPSVKALGNTIKKEKKQGSVFFCSHGQRGGVVGPAEGVGVAVLCPWPEDPIEVVTREGFQPPQDHFLRFFHRLDPLQGPVVGS